MRSASPRRALGLVLVLLLASCTNTPPRPPSPTTSPVAASIAPVQAATDFDASSPYLKLSQPSPDDVGALLEPIIARHGIPGMAAAVLKGDQLVALGVAGVRKKGTDARVTPSDAFELSSATKAITATLIARLVEQGRLRWSSTLPELFGKSCDQIDPAWTHVTLHQVLTQQAGFTDHLFQFRRNTDAGRTDNLSQQRLDYVSHVLAHPPSYTPGSKAVYCNTNYIIAGAAIEQLTGRSFETLLREELFEPLGLTGGGVGPPGKGEELTQPWGHGRRRLFYVPMPGRSDHAYAPSSSSADYPLAGAAAGMVHLSIIDWAAFVALHLRGDTANPNRHAQILREETWDQLHQAPSVELYESASGRKPLANAHYSPGWFVTTKPWAKGNRPGDTGRVLYHQGDNGRWNCVVWIAPEIDFAILVACNRASMWGPCDEAVSALLKAYKPKQAPVTADSTAAAAIRSK
jgi:D-alanyl-D-alanine carboxypeptidase